MGNGGYTSLHTDVHLVYDAPSDQFLRGNHVVLTDRATQCLTDFSLDFERTSVLGADGPDLTVGSVTVNGRPASWHFVQPTYPGDPGARTTRTRWRTRRRRSRRSAVRDANPFPPACSPQVTGNDVNAAERRALPGQQARDHAAAAAAAGDGLQGVRGLHRPTGVHLDGDGSTEGWFRSDHPAGDGGFVTTEPVGTEDWMPLNNHPSAKPTYDFYDTVNAGRTAIANGRAALHGVEPAGR